MRRHRTKNGFKVNVISGTHVVLFGFNLPKEKCDGLLGFSISREDHTEGEKYYLKATKVFKETDPQLKPGTQYSTKNFPIQSFQWADYSAKPLHKYTYNISAIKGTPEQLVTYASVKITIHTESEKDETNNVFFNRGTAASQEYVRRFGDISPSEVDNNRAFKWLSRGAYEALVDFIETCIPGTHSLRIAAYEFHYLPLLKVIKQAIDKGIDIQIIYDGRKEYPRSINESAIAEAEINSHCKPRLNGKSYISHNKFILKLENGSPISVWTGGMNFSEGGIFGHSNVAHEIHSPQIAMKFKDYWDALSKDLDTKTMRATTEEISPTFSIPLRKTETAIFSPRTNLSVLQNYANLALLAKEAIFATFAFGMNDLFKQVYKNSSAYLRFALMDKPCMIGKDKERTEAEKNAINILRFSKSNVFALGNMIKTNKLDGWLQERLSGLNSNVKYIHNKFMLIDPLSRKPIVITGSANFSDASTRQNDENMLIIRGNTRIADIYLGEYMRLFSHYAFRESIQWRKPNDQPKYLRTDDWWADYFKDNSRNSRRRYFAQVSE